MLQKQPAPAKDEDQLLAEAIAQAHKARQEMLQKQGAGPSQPSAKYQIAAELEQGSDAVKPGAGSQPNSRPTKSGKKLSKIQAFQQQKEQERKEQESRQQMVTPQEQQLLLQRQMNRIRHQQEQQKARSMLEGLQKQMHGPEQGQGSLHDPAVRQKMKAEGKSIIKQHLIDAAAKQPPMKGAPKKSLFQAKDGKHTKGNGSSSGSGGILDNPTELQQHVLAQYKAFLKGSAEFRSGLLTLQLELARQQGMQLPYKVLDGMCSGLRPSQLSKSERNDILQWLSSPPNQTVSGKLLQKYGQSSASRPSSKPDLSGLARFSIPGSYESSDQDLADFFQRRGLPDTMGLADQDLLGPRQEDVSSLFPGASLSRNPLSQKSSLFGEARKADSDRSKMSMPPDFWGSSSPLGSIVGDLDDPRAEATPGEHYCPSDHGETL